MRGISSWFNHVLVTAACLILVGNAVLYQRMATKLSGIESAVSKLRQTQAETGQLLTNESGSAAASDPWRALQTGRLAQGAQGAQGAQAAAMQKLLQAKANYNPGGDAMRMDQLMAHEPSMPAAEQHQVQLLESAMQNMPANAPQPTGLQTACRGRRCMISAGFADEAQAQDWASRYLLVGGRNLPQVARTIAVPLAGANGAVSLQLYLY